MRRFTEHAIAKRRSVVSMVPEGSTHPRGEALFEELIWIHGIIRSNLETIGFAPVAKPEANRALLNPHY